ncbi:MAG: hypothetical protein IKN70_10030 [Fibrobacter sp.]|nr:hypothetical protein [Fibrobacter sp.]MBO7062080.1 hypothetical protein [Fibrobacter sp.]MBO7106111.1 hypothetical protein [Fibrobacter sp.]MBR3670326.1 hypothetical protein [Fibrobacter sp.]
MAKWRNVMTMVLVAGSLALAQYDYDYDESTSSDTEQSYSYGESDGEDDFDKMDAADAEKKAKEEADKPIPTAEEDDSKVGKATASGDEWEGFRYEEMGLTQWEFQQAKEEGVTREKLTHLVELGIRPSEYLQKPWMRLGVTEEQWLSQRSQGLEDADIDRSYRNRSGDQGYAYLSLLLPSLYQWKVGHTSKAVWIDALWVAGVGATAYMAYDKNSNWFYFLIPVIGAHIWSFADAFFSTQWANNPDANRFSFGIIPTPDKGVASMLQMKF